MAVKLINGDESYEAASRSTPTSLPACLQRRRGKKPCFYLLSAALWCLQKPNNKMQLSPFCETELLECTFESGSAHPKPSCQCSCSNLCSLSVYLWLSGRLLSNNFHVSLILKGQKLLRSQQWADGGWLNMHLIPFGLVSVSKPPTFLSHNHSYRFSNQFRPWLGLRWLLINSHQLSYLQKMCGL